MWLTVEGACIRTAVWLTFIQGIQEPKTVHYIRHGACFHSWVIHFCCVAPEEILIAASRTKNIKKKNNRQHKHH